MKKRILSEFINLAGAAYEGTVSVKRGLTQYIKSQVESLILDMDFVKREDFEVIRKIASENRMKLDKLFLIMKEKGIITQEEVSVLQKEICEPQYDDSYDKDLDECNQKEPDLEESPSTEDNLSKNAQEENRV